MRRPKNSTPRRINGWAIAAITILVSGAILLSQRIFSSNPQPLDDTAMPVVSGGPTDYVPSTIATIATPLPDLDILLQSLPQTATPFPGPGIPARIEIKSVNIDALVVTVTMGDDGFIAVPDRYAGYWGLSSPLDQNGNTVIVGHNHLDPRPIFRDLTKVKIGDEIKITDQFGEKHLYTISDMLVFHVSGASPEEANRPREYAQPTTTTRLTLITCAPDESCADRLIILANPISQ